MSVSRPVAARLTPAYASVVNVAAELPGVTHRTLDGAGGVRLHCAQAGAASSDRPAVVLLHGFPEFWYGWRHQIPAVAAAGFHVVAPDLRGYNTSDKPPGVADYRIDLLAADVAAVIRQVSGNGGRAHLVGHDWGGVVAWHLAMHHPDVVEKLVILNAPHPAAYLRELRRPGQLLRSWYAFFFQLPRLPESFIRSGNFRALRDLFRHGPARAGAFSEVDIDRYVEAFSRPGALAAAINYYRAAFRRGAGAASRSVRRIDLPTLLIWGDRDRYLVPGLTHGLGQWVTKLRVERLPTATHWVQHDEPETVNRLLVRFLDSDEKPRMREGVEGWRGGVVE
jgi:pimeloyl-ACP methyl ester carboxylesterase